MTLFLLPSGAQEHPELVGGGDLDHIVAKTDNDENSRSDKSDIFDSEISEDPLLKLYIVKVIMTDSIKES